MAKPVWSVRFIHQRSPAGTYSYTVPIGKRAVIRSITFAWVNSETREFFVRRNGVVFYAGKPTGSTYGGGGTELRQVLTAGELLELVLQGADTGVMISGYLLDDLAGALRGREHLDYAPLEEGEDPAGSGGGDLDVAGR